MKATPEFRKEMKPVMETVGSCSAQRGRLDKGFGIIIKIIIKAIVKKESPKSAIITGFGLSFYDNGSVYPAENRSASVMQSSGRSS